MHGFSNALSQFLTCCRFSLGRQLLRREADNEEIFRGRCCRRLSFTQFPCLFEVRIIPQLNTWIYGYFPSDFLQQIRDGGYRQVCSWVTACQWRSYHDSCLVCGCVRAYAESHQGLSPAGIIAYLGICCSAARVRRQLFMEPLGTSCSFCQSSSANSCCNRASDFCVKSYPLLRTAHLCPDQRYNWYSSVNQHGTGRTLHAFRKWRKTSGKSRRAISHSDGEDTDEIAFITTGARILH